MYDGIPHQVKQRADGRGITAEDMEKSQHTDFNEDTTDESAKARKATHGLDGQHQDVDRTLRGRVNQNDRGQG